MSKQQQQYEVISYRQAPDSTERNAQAIADLLSGRRQFKVPDFDVVCLDCGHKWSTPGETWGYEKTCPKCGGHNTR